MHSTAVERKRIAFRVQRRFDRPREAVFRAWTDPQILKRWWCPEGWEPAEIELDLRAGGAYRIGMKRNGSLPVFAYGVFEEVSEPEWLAYTWNWDNAFSGMPPTRVTVRFEDAGSGTLVELTHEGLPEAGVCLHMRAGWIAALSRIALFRNS